MNLCLSGIATFVTSYCWNTNGCYGQVKWYDKVLHGSNLALNRVVLSIGNLKEPWFVWILSKDGICCLNSL